MNLGGGERLCFHQCACNLISNSELLHCIALMSKCCFCGFSSDSSLVVNNFSSRPECILISLISCEERVKKCMFCRFMSAYKL